MAKFAVVEKLSGEFHLFGTTIYEALLMSLVISNSCIKQKPKEFPRASKTHPKKFLDQK